VRATNQFACGNSKDLLPTFCAERGEGVVFVLFAGWYAKTVKYPKFIRVLLRVAL